ncbi:MAG: magnesium/cobalt transporter CorA [Thermoplasmata archaeon]|nr:MAG: magnesium/cobalt transporter CorA [Thermoplasmata archaeon]
MPRLIKKASKAAGLPPGTLIHIGEKRTEKVKITIMDYDEKQFNEIECKTTEECFSFKDKPTVTWINIDGIHQVEIIDKLGKYFNFHPLLLEDIANTEQRPKAEDFDSYVFIVLKMLYYDEKKGEIIAEQVSIVLGSNYVISFQEREGDVFNSVRDRIRNSKGRIRRKGPDYLAYALLDAIVDSYFVILEKFGEIIESLEEELITEPEPETLQKIYSLKREMIFLRKSIWPLREVVSGIERGGSELIKEDSHIYLRDAYDHTIQVIDTIETYRDMLSGLLDLYMSSISNRMNEVMKVLTIIATIFIPLTFIAGIYGMNFNPDASPFNMPELNWDWGYLVTWTVMILVVIMMVIYFKRKKWL